MCVHLPNEKVNCILLRRWFDGGLALSQFGYNVGTVICLTARVRTEVAPCTVPGKGAIELLLNLRLLLGPNEWKDGTRNNWNIRSMDEFKHAQRVLNFLGLPCVSTDHGDAEYRSLRGLQQHHHRHLIGAAGTGSVLIDENQAFGLGGREYGQHCAEQKRTEGSKFADHDLHRVPADSRNEPARRIGRLL